MPHRRLRGRGLVSSLLLIGVVSLFHPGHAQAQWAKDVDWLVLCVAGTEERLDPAATTCDAAGMEAATDPIVGSVKATLDATSRWLEGLGFASPRISAGIDVAGHIRSVSGELQELQLANHWDPRCEPRYCVWLVYGFPGKKFGAYNWLSESLALDPFHRSTDAEDIASDETPAQFGFRENYGFSEIHELFHAVQHGYPDVMAMLADEYLRWLIEGTAEHVAIRAANRLGISASSGWRRPYDIPLHSPPTEDTRSRDFARWAYGSWEFFAFLGDYLDTADGVDYIHSIFSDLVPGQKNGLLAVDHAIRFHSDGGLDEAYTEFVRQRLIEPCFFSHLGQWERHDCTESADNEHRFSLSFPDTVARLHHMAAAVGANGYLVRTTIPEGQAALLTIRVPPDHDADYLRLIVDDARLDRVTGSEARNEFRTILRAGLHEILVRLVNVPSDLTEVSAAAGLDFSAIDPAPIEFLLQREYVSTQVTGSESAHGGGDGPTPTDIAQPLEFEVADGDFTVFYVAPGDPVAEEMDLDHPVCTVWIKLRSREGDALWVMGSLSPPIRAGTYSIVRHSEGERDRLGTQFWTSRTGGRGRLRTFGQSGRLEIANVDHRMIEGSLWTHVQLGLEGGDVNLLVQAEFGLQPGSMVGGILGPKASDHPCFSPDDTAKGEDPGRQENPRDRKDSRKKTPEDDEVTEETGDGRGSGGFARASEDEDETDGVGAPGDPVARPPADGDAPPAEDVPTGDGAVAEASLQLEFLDQQGGSIRSRPQVAIGSHSPERVDVSASSFDVQLAIHQDRVWQCVETKSSGVAGIYALTGMGMSGATALDWDGWYRIDIREAGVRLDVDAGAARLEVDFEQCHEETGHCQSGLIVVRAGPGAVRLAPTGDGSTRVEVSAGTLVATVDRRKGSCDEFVDFSATLKVLP